MNDSYQQWLAGDPGYAEWLNQLDQQSREAQMALHVKDDGGKTFVKVPAGNHLGVCDMVVDLGMQETAFGLKPKVYIRFELPAVRITGREGKEVSASIGKLYTLSLNQKSTLSQMLEAWRGSAFTEEQRRKGIDVFSVLGRAAMVNVAWRVGQDGKERDEIANITPLPAGLPPPVGVNVPVKFSKSDPTTLMNVTALPEWIRKKLDGPPAASKALAAAGKAALGMDPDDTIPFAPLSSKIY